MRCDDHPRRKGQLNGPWGPWSLLRQNTTLRTICRRCAPRIWMIGVDTMGRADVKIPRLGLASFVHCNLPVSIVQGSSGMLASYLARSVICHVVMCRPAVLFKTSSLQGTRLITPISKSFFIPFRSVGWAREDALSRCDAGIYNVDWQFEYIRPLSKVINKFRWEPRTSKLLNFLGGKKSKAIFKAKVSVIPILRI